jgi:transcription factor MYB, plant
LSPKSSISVSGEKKASGRQGNPEPEQPSQTGKEKKIDASSPLAATSAASSPPQSDDGARSAVLDPEQSQPNNRADDGNTPDGPCSEDATGPMALVEDPLDLGLWEAESEMDMEALLLSTTTSTGIDAVGGSFTEVMDAVGEAPVVDDLLEMDWDGFAAHLWGDPAQNDQSGTVQAAEPQAAAGCDPELESFATWLLSDF